MRMNLMTRLVAAFAAVALIVGAVSIYIMVESNRVAFIYEHEAIRLYKNHVRLAAIEGRIQKETASVRGYLLMPGAGYLEEYREADAKLLNLMEDLIASTDHPESEAKMAKVLALRDQYNKSLQQVVGLVGEGKLQEAQTLYRTEVESTAEGMTLIIGDLSKVYGDAADRGGTEARAAADIARTAGVTALGVGLAVALLAGILLARYISRPILRTAALAKEVAAGNLQVEPLNERAKDEVGDLARSFNRMVLALRSLVTDMSESSLRVTASAEALAATSEQALKASEQATGAITTVAEGATRQAETTAAVTGIVQQLQQAIGQVANGAAQTSQDVQDAVISLNRIAEEVDTLNKNAGQVASASIQNAETARSGAKVVAQTAQGMARIKAAVETSSLRIQQLDQLSRQIGEISAVISGIADQTNLLALNAAIEAARAGEHGKGFAVVAEEVRKLAESSSKSAKEIGALISRIQSGTAEVVQAMAVGTAEVDTGHRFADEAGLALSEILGVAEKTAHEVKNMAQAVQAVQMAAKSVSEAFGSIAAVTEENTAATEQMAASAEEVTDALAGMAV
ncbi:MAG TPA: methyl-accepting chemotaxis protein, partial [Symbiobacteriaceae bacterium]|nr:methyl-accepting chemotaxis protein [Symbiobacteriaceae bacterium]